MLIGSSIIYMILVYHDEQKMKKRTSNNSWTEHKDKFNVVFKLRTVKNMTKRSRKDIVSAYYETVSKNNEKTSNALCTRRLLIIAII